MKALIEGGEVIEKPCANGFSAGSVADVVNPETDETVLEADH